MSDPSKPSIIARGVEQAIRALCELWGYELDEKTALPDADDLQPVSGELEVEDDVTPSDAPTVELDAEALADDDGMPPLDIRDTSEAEAIHREAIRHLLELAEDLHQQAAESMGRPPTRPV